MMDSTLPLVFDLRISIPLQSGQQSNAGAASNVVENEIPADGPDLWRYPIPSLSSASTVAERSCPFHRVYPVKSCGGILTFVGKVRGLDAAGRLQMR